MFCSKCGNEVEEGVQFCSKCGNNLSGSSSGGGQANTQNQQQPTQIIVAMPTGTAPLVLGLLGIFGFLIPIVKYFTTLMALIAVILGGIQRSKLKKAGLPKGKATAGVVLGIIALSGLIITTLIRVLFFGSLISMVKPKPKKQTDTYIYVAPVKPPEFNLQGKWKGGTNSKYLFIFSGNEVTWAENKNYKIDGAIAVYRKKDKGTFVNTKNFETPKGIIPDEKIEKLILRWNQEWKNGEWKEKSESVEVFYLRPGDTSFLLTDQYVSMWSDFKEYFYQYKESLGESINYE